MADFAADQLLKIDEKTYRQHFPSPAFGVLLAQQVARANCVVSQLQRIDDDVDPPKQIHRFP